MMNLNRVTLVGRVGRDPELKNLVNGSKVATFTLAVNRRTGNRDEPPDWFDIEVWERTADIAASYVRKGSLIGITGVLRFDRWQDRNSGEDRQKPIIRAEQMDLLGSRRDSESPMDGDF
jgi:single-strand DNA-binding protein